MRILVSGIFDTPPTGLLCRSIKGPVRSERIFVLQGRASLVRQLYSICSAPFADPSKTGREIPSSRLKASCKVLGLRNPGNHWV